MKCLPNCQNIDMSDIRYIPFWKKMVEARLPLLVHTGGEHTVPVVNAALADPKLLRTPLECGVTVIAAHCGTKSGVLDHDYFDDWVAMLQEFQNLYGDISAMVSLNRCAHLGDCLRARNRAAHPSWQRFSSTCARPSSLAARSAGPAVISPDSSDRQPPGKRLAVQESTGIFRVCAHSGSRIA